MKIAFDTNVLPDAIANRAGFQEAQALIMAVVAEKKMTVTMTVAAFLLPLCLFKLSNKHSIILRPNLYPPKPIRHHKINQGLFRKSEASAGPKSISAFPRYTNPAQLMLA